MSWRDVLELAAKGAVPDETAARAFETSDDLEALLPVAAALRDQGHGEIVSYSPKVFIPLTRLCRDVCHYCTFATAPRALAAPYLSPDQILAIARAGVAAGCHEALFTLGDKPELRYQLARAALRARGHATTLDYLAEMAALVFEETGLLPHINAGVMDEADIRALRRVSVSQGLMLESVAGRLMAPGQPHHGSPDKDPARRLATIEAAGRAAVPFTTGLLIGIGETRLERIEALLAIRALHARHGHVQEVIVQPFRAKPKTRMANHPDAPEEELLWTVAVARLILGPRASIQAPPNLSDGPRGRLIEAGIDDWGGVSPLTRDHVNPERPWPHLQVLVHETAAAGKTLVQRLAVYPAHAREPERWLDRCFVATVLSRLDATGLVRDDDWRAGDADQPTPTLDVRPSGGASDPLRRSLARATAGEGLDEDEIVRLFAARGPDLACVLEAADRLRARVSGNGVAYVVNRNINYTNMCTYRCGFCAFSKGRTTEHLRGRPYRLEMAEVARRVREAWKRGATEVCLQGGIHPEYTGSTYLEILETVKAAAPDIHVHAFSPLEVRQGAATLGLDLRSYLAQLKGSGLGTLPGTAAEILDDEVRAVICPDKLTTVEWLEVMRAAHGLGLRSTTTIMFGHVEGPEHWARHLLRLRALEAETGGFTEFVPLPFVHMEAPIALKGRARSGPTFREAILMHAVGRLALHPLITNVQASWVKLGPEGAKLALRSGANDLGGTLMNESISRAAGAAHGQELPPAAMDALIRGAGRVPRQRTTTYGTPPHARIELSYEAAPLEPAVLTPVGRRRASSAA
jgi:FO synthase